jgi:hypothetical protein
MLGVMERDRQLSKGRLDSLRDWGAGLLVSELSDNFSCDVSRHDSTA